MCVVYDSVSKKRYYYRNDTPYQTTLTATTKTWRFVSMYYMIDYQLAGKYAFLRSLCRHAFDGGLVNNLYDINYATKHTQAYQSEMVFFDDDGKAIDPNDYITKINPGKFRYEV